MNVIETVQNLNVRASYIGTKLMMEAFANKEYDKARALINEGISMYDRLLAFFDTDFTYEAWHAMFFDLNRNSTLHQLDTTGEFTKLVKEMEGMDLHDWYEDQVVTLRNPAGRVALLKEKAMIAGALDMINETEANDE